MTRSLSNAARLAKGLGWFSIGLGLTELLLPRQTARATGLQGSERVLQAYGAREIATGLGLLLAARPARFLWGRVAGDALDLATLAAAATTRRGPARRNAQLAIGMVAGVAVVDWLSARAVSTTPTTWRDYSDRSGLPRPAVDMRGAAASSFQTPRDYAVPEALRPLAVV
jgi:hypothetical protein